MAAESPPNPERETEEGGRSRPSGGGLVAWIRGHRLKAALLLLSLLLSLGTAGAVAFLLWGPRSGEGLTIAQALAALDEGRMGEARRMATALHQAPEASADQQAAAAFVLGATVAHEAEKAREANRKEMYLVAARYLEEARDRGFPAGRQPEAMRLLGRSLFGSGQIVASRPVLREALKSGATSQPALHHLLAEAILRDGDPDFKGALDENTRYLECPGLSKGERQQGLLQRARILLALDRMADCTEVLDQIPANARNRAEATLLRGQLQLRQAQQLPRPLGAESAAETAEASEFRQKMEAAIATLREAESQDTLDSQVSGKAMYLIGVALLELKDHRSALKQFARILRIHPGTPEAFAAVFQEADVMRRLGKDQDAVVRYCQVLDRLGPPESFFNPWLTLSELRKHLQRTHQQYLDAEKYEAASQLAGRLHPVFSRKQQLEIAARTHRYWGQSLLTQAATLPPSKAEELLRQGYRELRRAAQQYEDLALLRIAEREYTDDLWESALCYLDGHDFQGAARLFQQYLKSETRRRHARALVGLAGAQLANGQPDEALAAASECVDLHPRDAASYRARLLAAQAALEKNLPERAKAFLQENLNGEALTPVSLEWQESLIQLGRLFYRQGEYPEAIERLREAVQRYPELPQLSELQYLIADAHRLYARQLELKLQDDQVEDKRLARSRKVRELLTVALGGYRGIQETLAHRQETDELRPLERLLLRNCYFAIGHVLFQLQNYEEAIKSYTMATNRYQSSPEVLEAYVQIARAYRKLDMPEESRVALEQAQLVLARLKPDAPFQETTNHSLQEWKQILGTLASG